jgi:7-keto-8-aminopelargonate synthetase-like enzyme
MTFQDFEPVHGQLVSGPASARWTIGGQEYVNFSGAGYLALHREPALRNAAYAALDQGCAFAQQLGPLYGLLDPPLDEVEAAAGDFIGTETAMYFASGFFLGQIGLCAFAEPNDHLYVDSTAHYNLGQAARVSGLEVTTFAHRDPDALREEILRTIRPGERPLVLTDGMFATTGDLAPLDLYAETLAPFDGRIFVDDAHGFGIVGAQGRGTAEQLGVEDIAYTGGTLSKAFCAQGAVIGCSHETAQRVNHIPPKRGANAGSPISQAVGAASLRYMKAHPERRERLWEVSAHARRRLRTLGVAISDAPTPVMAFTLGDRRNMRRIQRRLFDQGLYLPISDYIGAGPEGVFRCAVFADHSMADVDRLADALAAAA